MISKIGFCFHSFGIGVGRFKDSLRLRIARFCFHGFGIGVGRFNDSLRLRIVGFCGFARIVPL